MTRPHLLLAVICLAAVTSFAQTRQLAVITNKANSTSNLATADLTKILKGQKRNWPDGVPVTVVMRDASNADTRLALRRLLDLTPEQTQAFIQTHRDIIKTVNSDDEVLGLVVASRGAIGIVGLYHITKDITVVKIDGKLPVEQGYLLRENSL